MCKSTEAFGYTEVSRKRESPSGVKGPLHNIRLDSKHQPYLDIPTYHDGQQVIQ